jgi:hypothetical protein
MPNKFRTGDHVIDIETGIEGRVIFQFDPELSEEIVVVRFPGDEFGVAFPIDDLRHAAH